MRDSPLTFDEYWTAFVRAHESALVRRVHFVATTAGIGFAVAGVFGRRLSLLLAAPAVALVPTWLARQLSGAAGAAPLPQHAVFRMVASLKLWAMMLTGTMSEEGTRDAHAESEEGGNADADQDLPHPPPNMVTDHTLH